MTECSMRIIFLMLVFVMSTAGSQSKPAFAHPDTTVDSLRAAASSGDLNSMRELCADYAFGISTAPRAKDLFLWAQRGALRNDSVCMFFLAECYRHGWGCPTQIATAAKLYRTLSASLRSVLESKEQSQRAMRAWLLYIYASECATERERSYSLMEQALSLATTLRYPPALLRSARIKLLQAQTEIDSMRAMAEYREAADVLYIPAMIELSDILVKRPSTQPDAVLYALKAAQLGSSEAATRCGSYLFSGRGVQRDTLRSEKMLIQAVAAGSSTAAAELAFRLHKGYGVKESKGRTAFYLWLAFALQEGEREDYRTLLHRLADSTGISAGWSFSGHEPTCLAAEQILENLGKREFQDIEALRSCSRRIWKRLGINSGDGLATDEMWVFASDGASLHTWKNSEMTWERSTGRWILTNDTLMITEGTRVSLFNVKLVSPGLLVLQDFHGTTHVFERMLNVEIRRIQKQLPDVTAFGISHARIVKVDLDSLARIRVQLDVNNAPCDGMSVSIDSVHSGGQSWVVGQSGTLRFMEDDVVYGSGEHRLLFDIRRQLPQCNEKSNCSMTLRLGSTVDGEYRQFILRTREVALPQRR